MYVCEKHGEIETDWREFDQAVEAEIDEATPAWKSTRFRNVGR